jgi:hypothetical protein
VPSEDTALVWTIVIVLLCQDLSRNGVVLNGQPIKKASVILVDGDVLELPNMLCKANATLNGVLLTKNTAFTCAEVKREQREKLTIFDPTPPPQLAQKVRKVIRVVLNYSNQILAHWQVYCDLSLSWYRLVCKCSSGVRSFQVSASCLQKYQDEARP